MEEESHEHGLNRRQFVAGMGGILGGIMAAVVGLPAIGYLIAPGLKQQQTAAWVPLGPVADLKPGEPALYTFTITQQTGWETTANSYGAYVIAKPGGQYDVFSNTCTHLACRVNWRDEANQFVCPCHDGRFDEAGAVVAGPPPRPLDRYEYKVENGTLMIHVVEA
jgi:menaquinol-cytochrome c reductase iron-sulfur subunit